MTCSSFLMNECKLRGEKTRLLFFHMLKKDTGLDLEGKASGTTGHQSCIFYKFNLFLLMLKKV